MKNDDFLRFFQNLPGKKEEKSFLDYFGILYRRKWILAGVMISFLGAAYLYSALSEKTYVSSVLMKKEQLNENNRRDEFNRIIENPSNDKIETEMKLVKTGEVLKKVIDELKLNLVINEVRTKNAHLEQLNDLYIDYVNKNLMANPSGHDFPKFVEFNGFGNNSKEYRLVKNGDGSFTLYNGENLDEVAVTPPGESAIFELGESNMVIDWKDAEEGAVLGFTILSDNAALTGLEGKINLELVDETNLFRINVTSSLPQTARLLANTIAEKYKASRIDQQKRSIRYSSRFVDEQLDEITNNLREAEDNLQKYRSRNRMVSISKNSEQVVELLSNLEVERVNVDLELSDYSNKLNQIQTQYKEQGYFDQTYLTPSKSSEAYSPFSSLLLKLADLEVERIEALNRRKEDHPEVLKIDEQISEIKGKLGNYNQNTITAYNVIINSLTKKKQNIEDMIREYNTQLALLPQKETQYASFVRERDAYEKVFTLLLDKKEELRLAELSTLNDIEVVESAFLPLSPATPRTKFNMMAGAFFGIVFGLMFVTIAEIVSRKKLKLDDITDENAAPLLAIIPNYTRDIKQKIENSKKLEDRFVVLMNTDLGYKETYRILRTKIMNSSEKMKTIMFTSCEEDSGKSTIVANLALMFVQSGKKVLMIDCDLKRGRLSNMFNVSKKASGLITAIEEERTDPKIYSLLKPSKNNGKYDLNLIPPGGIKHNSSEILESEYFEKFVKSLDSYPYDYVLIDTPPVNRVVDPLIIGKHVKNSIMIVRPNYTLKDSFKWGMLELKDAKIKVDGIVVNACDIEHSPFKYSYGYGYGYDCDYSDAEPAPNGNGRKTSIQSATPI